MLSFLRGGHIYDFARSYTQSALNVLTRSYTYLNVDLLRLTRVDVHENTDLIMCQFK